MQALFRRRNWRRAPGARAPSSFQSLLCSLYVYYKIKLCPPINKSSLYMLHKRAEYIYEYAFWPLLTLSISIFTTSHYPSYISLTLVPCSTHTPPTHASIHQLSCRSDSIHTYSTGLALLYLRMFCTWQSQGRIRRQGRIYFTTYTHVQHCHTLYFYCCISLIIYPSILLFMTHNHNRILQVIRSMSNKLTSRQNTEHLNTIPHTMNTELTEYNFCIILLLCFQSPTDVLEPSVVGTARCMPWYPWPCSLL